MRRVDAADPVDHAGLADDLGDLVGDVRDVEPATRPEMPLLLVNLHRGESNAGRRSGQSRTVAVRYVPRAGP